MSSNTETEMTPTITTPSDREIRVERIFNAPRARVWQAYTDNKLVAQWWGRGNELTIERNEVERGGHWRFVEHADGETYGFEGRYREVTPPEFISRTFEWDGQPGHVLVENVTFEELDADRTKLTLTSLFLTQEDRDGMLEAGATEGMRQSFAALDRLLAEMA